MTITQTITLKASPEKVYDALTSSTAFAKVTNAPAEIAPEEGGAFSCFSGQVTGRHIELKPDQRIVQAWRIGPWPDGVYSIVRLDLRQAGSATTLTLTHDGYPADHEEHLDSGWHKMYWEPLKAYLE